MHANSRTWILLASLAAVSACADLSTERSPFLSYTEEYGIAGQQQTQDGDDTGGGGASTEGYFRRDMTVTLRNTYGGAEVNCAFVAWVNVSSIRTADQQDALFRGGYSQLTREHRIGSAITLPVGTFVYDGGGTAGATAIVLGRAQQTGAGDNALSAPTILEITLITPDGILLFSQPPVSCESVAFYFTDDGEPLTSELLGGGASPWSGSNRAGGFKTLAQVSAYSCSPFRPGLYFSTGGTREPNEYLEGEAVTYDFQLIPDANGNAAIVTIGSATTDTTGGDGTTTP